MFALTTPTAATVSNVNPRNEKHGEEDVLAVDVSFTASLPNTALSMFHEGLLEALYLPPDGAQQVIDGVPPASTALRCPELAPSKLKTKLAGRNVTIHRATSDLELPTSKVGRFVVDAKEGGTVELSFQVQCSGIPPETVGELAGMLNQSVEITVAESQAADEDDEQDDDE